MYRSNPVNNAQPNASVVGNLEPSNQGNQPPPTLLNAVRLVASHLTQNDLLKLGQAVRLNHAYNNELTAVADDHMSATIPLQSHENKINYIQTGTLFGRLGMFPTAHLSRFIRQSSRTHGPTSTTNIASLTSVNYLLHANAAQTPGAVNSAITTIQHNLTPHTLRLVATVAPHMTEEDRTAAWNALLNSQYTSNDEQMYLAHDQTTFIMVACTPADEINDVIYLAAQNLAETKKPGAWSRAVSTLIAIAYQHGSQILTNTTSSFPRNSDLHHLFLSILDTPNSPQAVSQFLQQNEFSWNHHSPPNESVRHALNWITCQPLFSNFRPGIQNTAYSQILRANDNEVACRGATGLAGQDQPHFDVAPVLQFANNRKLADGAISEADLAEYRGKLEGLLSTNNNTVRTEVFDYLTGVLYASSQHDHFGNLEQFEFSTPNSLSLLASINLNNEEIKTLVRLCSLVNASDAIARLTAKSPNVVVEALETIKRGDFAQPWAHTMLQTLVQEASNLNANSAIKALSWLTKGFESDYDQLGTMATWFSLNILAGRAIKNNPSNLTVSDFSLIAKVAEHHLNRANHWGDWELDHTVETLDKVLQLCPDPRLRTQVAESNFEAVIDGAQIHADTNDPLLVSRETLARFAAALSEQSALEWAHGYIDNVDQTDKRDALLVIEAMAPRIYDRNWQNKALNFLASIPQNEHNTTFHYAQKALLSAKRPPPAENMSTNFKKARID